MTALLTAQTFPQSPIENDKFAGAVVVKQVAGMGIAVKDRILH